jgi:hypothetical protein
MYAAIQKVKPQNKMQRALKMSRPFDGMDQISDAPFVNAISHLGQ